MNQGFTEKKSGETAINNRGTSEVWNSLVATTSDLYPDQLMQDIEQAYEDDLIDPGNIDFVDVQRDLAMGMKPILERLSDDPHHRTVENTISEIEWWTCFRRDEWDEEDELDLPDPSDTLDEYFADEPTRFTVTSTITPSQPKIGRNEPCPCGSGKKYKKCCGN